MFFQTPSVFQWFQQCLKIELTPISESVHVIRDLIASSQWLDGVEWSPTVWASAQDSLDSVACKWQSFIAHSLRCWEDRNQDITFFLCSYMEQTVNNLGAWSEQAHLDLSYVVMDFSHEVFAVLNLISSGMPYLLML